MKKISQCRYCINSSNDGNGVWLNKLLWICEPCIDKIQCNRKKLIKNEIEQIKKLTLSDKIEFCDTDTVKGFNTSERRYILSSRDVRDYIKEYIDWIEQETKVIVINPKFRKKADEMFGEKLTK